LQEVRTWGETKLFVSYSHRDRPWLERLKVHLAILERRGIVHVWSDTGIAVGAKWREEIEAALTESRAAVLVISPDFLGSDFIWHEEIPRILEHEKQGMTLLPLIVRPCAWRIAPELAELQARPMEGRPLSLGTEAEVDRDLAEFVYEIGSRLEQLPAAVAREEIVLARAQARIVRDTPPVIQAPQVPVTVGAEEAAQPIEEWEAWVGVYHPKRRIRLLISERTGRWFRGQLQYLDDRSVTDTEGAFISVPEAFAHEALREIKARVGPVDSALSFRETRIVQRGNQPPDLDGEYVALVSGSVMTGVWQSKGSTVGTFELRKEK
jgi:hypothetical protein